MTAASELARNTLVHGGGGTARVEVVTSATAGPASGSRFADDGPGIPDVDLALTDGWTTGGGLGLGLSGARRLVDEFELTSEPGARHQRGGHQVVALSCAARPASARRRTCAGSGSRTPARCAACRSAGAGAGQRLGFPAARAEELALAVTEAASNLHKHAREGSLLLRVNRDGGRRASSW